jgi:hypothetical protein
MKNYSVGDEELTTTKKTTILHEELKKINL